MLEHTAEAKRFYKSKAWQDCRQSYISKVHGLCERCELTGLIVHHKEHINATNINDPYITLNHDNLEYLCQTCHNKEHFTKHDPLRDDVIFNDSGELVLK